jgi:hypothetical protein
MSIIDPSTKISHFIYTNLDKKCKVIDIFPGFNKAFEYATHDLLINKLEFCSIRGMALNLIKKFITERPLQD